MRSLFKKITLLFSLLTVCLIAPLSTKEAKAADGQTTIIILDKKGPYSIGEKVKVTVGVASTDGAYLKEAWCGFGYNGATMKLLSETDTEDHFRVTSDTSAKWLYYDLEFEMTANGKMFFIAGAYSGDGVIEAIKADGNHISLPRASVLYSIGTGIYTKVSDCNLDSLKITDQDGNEIEFNRSFDKNITSYSAVVAPSVDELKIEATTENPEDEIILPDLKVEAGENIKAIGVRATDGTIKEYTFTLTKPSVAAEVNDIRIIKENGEELEYEFDRETLRYDLVVENECTIICFDVDLPSEKISYEISGDETLETGYNMKDVRIYTDNDEKVYEFFIYREPSELTLTSLVAEGSDELTIKLDPEFNPEVTEYSGMVTPDVRRIKFIGTLANPEDYIKEAVEGEPEYELSFGTNSYTITVTDGINERVYTIDITRPEYEKIDSDEEDQGPYRNPYEFTYFQKRNLTILIIGAAAIFLIMALTNVIKAKHAEKEYKESEEAEIDTLKETREKRLKRLAKERKKQQKAKKKDL